MSGPVARIDLTALKHNLQVARRAAPRSRVMAVIKANAYGHGLLEVARALEDDADALAVARVEEGIALRRAGISSRVIVLEGCFDGDELMLAVEARLELVLHHHAQIQWIEQGLGAGPNGLACWIKIDTGMHRLGFRPEEAESVLAKLRAIQGVVVEGVMTHLANADDRDDSTTKRQLDEFSPVAKALKLPTSIANSAGILGWPDSHSDWIRPGIMLYGASPFLHTHAEQEGLRPVMTLSTKLIAVRDLRKGEPVGYGGTWRCPEDIRVGVAAIGYGDGYPRHAPNGTPVWVNGHQASLAGRVSMDMVALDLQSVPDAQIGDSVVLWGVGLPSETIANRTETISYELYCRLTDRVTFMYE